MENENNTSVENENEEVENKEVETQETEEKAMFTQADLDRQISKLAEKFEKKFAKREEEAKKLANMNAEEKAKYEFEQKVKQFEEKEREFTLKENKYEASKILSEKNLPLSFADFVVAEDAETMMANIKLFDKDFKNAVTKEVQSRIGGSTPQGGKADSSVMTKEKFAGLSLLEQQEIYNSNPELYKELTR